MAAIAPKFAFLSILLFWTAAADQPHDVLGAINQVANGLASGNPSDAITPFDKSLAAYTTLENEFIGLTEAYLVTNEADVLDEEDTSDESKLTLRWVLTLTGRQSNESNRKSAEVHVRLRLQKGKWKIVEFAPVDLFTP